MRFLVWAVFALTVFTKPQHVYGQDGGTRRFAFIIGANYGGVGRTPLRFANKDAGAIADVLQELGGVQEGDVILVEDATKVAVDTGLLQLRQLLQEASARQQRTEVLVYYSGHSNEEGLLLGNQLMRYKQLKAVLADLKADVRVMVLDSCESGSLLAQKGGKRRPAFLLDSAAKTKGQAIIQL